ncbi:MAG: glycosyltransferase family 2 protein [Actinobacteria bacterium]|nr:glycosyltransferase family 2 protein [Chloroflexota bacterium]MBE3128679.1 glycosyltransferase family 2 protein [Actinomycetota bacterium]
MLSIIIPVYNNSKTLRELNTRIVKSIKNEKFEIIYINDGSIDNSLSILKEIAKKNKNVRVFSFSRNFGQHPALSASFEKAKGDKIIFMDADLQDKPENIPLLLKHLKGNIDIVYTIRKDKKKSFIRDLTSNIFHQFVSRQVKMKVPKYVGTFRLFTRKVLEALLQYKEVNILYGPLMYYIGFNSCYIEIDRDERPYQKSSYSFSKRLKLAINTVITYTDLPYKIFSYIGLILLLGSILYVSVVIIQYIFFGISLPKGLTLIVVLLLFMFGSLVFCLGIVGIYLFRIFQEVLHRPRYLIDEVIDKNKE